MKLSSLITIRELLAEEIDKTEKEVNGLKEIININEDSDKRKTAYNNLMATNRYLAKLDLALEDIETADFH